MTRIATGPLCHHIEALTRRGWTVRQIAEAAGVGPETVRQLANRTCGRVRVGTHDRLMAVRVDDPMPDPPARTAKMVKLPVDPLVTFVAAATARTGSLRRALGDNTARAWLSALAQGQITERLADRVCCRLGCGPLPVIYGNDYDDDDDWNDDDHRPALSHAAAGHPEGDRPARSRQPSGTRVREPVPA